MSAGTERLARLREKGLDVAKKVEWFPPLLARVVLAAVFLVTGWGKVHNLAKVTEFFASLHIPAPGLNAALAGYSELICGALLLVGLASRFASIPLIVTMIVAIVTAKLDDVHSLRDVLVLEEFTYIVLLVYVLVSGPGLVSLDTVVARALSAKGGGEDKSRSPSAARA